MIPNTFSEKKFQNHYRLEKKLLELFSDPTVDFIKDLSDILEQLQELHKSSEKIDLKFLEHKPDSVLLESFILLEKQMKDIAESKSVPIIDLNLWTDFIKTFNTHYSRENVEHSLDHLKNQIAILSPESDDLPISLSSGKKTVITSHNFNLTNFTREELIEILRFLDVIVKDNKYDYLRTEIIDCLNSISEITVMK